MRIKDLWGAAAIVAALVSASPASAQATISRGEVIAYSCSGCHGIDFNGVGTMPPLRGRPAEELVTAMNEFRSNARYSTVMGRLVRGLSEDDVRAVSAWLAAQR